jgi:hypothetical protein
MVFVGAAVLFFLSWETASSVAEPLRAITNPFLAHIDMHQLTKDPESYWQSTIYDCTEAALHESVRVE